MIRIKNIRPGIVMVPGHRLRLAPGGIAAVEHPSAEIDRAIAAGLVVRIDAEPAAPTLDSTSEPPLPEAPALPSVSESPAAPTEPPAEEIAKLPQGEAIQHIALEADPKQLRALLAVDKRPRVQDAIRRRLAELESVAPR